MSFVLIPIRLMILMLDRNSAERIARGAGLEEKDIQEILKEAESLIGL